MAAFIDIWVSLMFQVKVGLSPSQKVGLIYFNERPLKMMQNTFLFHA